MNLKPATILLTGLLLMTASQQCLHSAERTSWQLTLRNQVRGESTAFHTRSQQKQWEPSETAIIVCDVWDSHHSINAVRRVNELVPRLNEVLLKARSQGATIIHAPSDCMPAYQDHPARQRAMDCEGIDQAPPVSTEWCSQIPAEEQGHYPIDQSDGGEDDDPREHAQWVEKLRAEGRTPGTPWLKQHPGLTIDAQRDYISDQGDEVWAILETHGIKHVILAGVHTNMCVLGRPFGLRQMVRQGRDVVLLRDMTDTMYNPQRWPYVSHFTGTDLIISHIERFICPTITSDQLIGGETFRFAGDTRADLVLVIGESLYRTAESLPPFALANLGQDFRITTVLADEDNPNMFPGLEAIDDADVVLISVRRRSLPKDQLDRIRAYCRSGRPLIGLRTSSHAFALRAGDPPAGHDVWPEFDAEVWGGNYHNHYSDEQRVWVQAAAGAESSDLLKGFPTAGLRSAGSLYKTSPVASGANVLLEGKVEGEKPEPIAWTWQRPDGGHSFYTSLGHPLDFEQPEFVSLLTRAIYAAAGRPLADERVGIPNSLDRRPWPTFHWNADGASRLGTTPDSNPDNDASRFLWARAVIHPPGSLTDTNVTLSLPVKLPAEAWLDGQPLAALPSDKQSGSRWRATLTPGVDHLLVVRFEDATTELPGAPRITAKDLNWELSGRWQFRLDSTGQHQSLPLPAQFGGSPDIFLTPANH